MIDEELIPTGRQVSLTEQFIVPAMIDSAGSKARKRFVEFFTANIANDNTRCAYATAVDRFLWWCHKHGYTLETIEPTLIAAYFKQGCPESRPQHPLSRATLADSSKKQHLAAIKTLFDYLVTGGIVEFNPAASVKGPKVVVDKGKTPVLSPADARLLLDTIDLTKIAGLRDRALISTMLYAFARVGAALAMNVDDLYENGRALWLRLHEKGGKYHEMPAHHKLAEYLDAYIDTAGIRYERGTPLFRTMDRNLHRVNPLLDVIRADVGNTKTRMLGSELLQTIPVPFVRVLRTMLQGPVEKRVEDSEDRFSLDYLPLSRLGHQFMELAERKLFFFAEVMPLAVYRDKPAVAGFSIPRLIWSRHLKSSCY